MYSAAMRSSELELMDLGTFDRPEYEVTLRQLEQINHLTNGYRPTLRALARFANTHRNGYQQRLRRADQTRESERPLRVLDIGFGHGDTLRAIRRWSQRASISVELTGIDINPLACEVAAAATPASEQIEFICADAFDLGAVGEFDVIINSLFMHHLRNGEIVRLLTEMTRSARLGWFINDLHRHAIAYHFIKHATRLFGFNRLICNDAPLSVARSFRIADWRSYLSEAGLLDEAAKVDIEIKWHFPFRYGIMCQKKPRENDEAMGEST